MVDPKDAPNVSIPMLMIPSKDEDQEAVDNYEKGLKVAHEVEWFKDQVHGFMAARSDLEDSKVKAAYEKAYQHLLDFFHKHL
jgi:dienelactone hydrolase